MKQFIKTRINAWISGCVRLHRSILFLIWLGVFVGLHKGLRATCGDFESVLLCGTVGALAGLLLYWIVLFPGELQTEMAMYSFANRLTRALLLTRALDRSVDQDWSRTIERTKEEVRWLTNFTSESRESWRKSGQAKRYGFDGVAFMVREMKRRKEPTWVPSSAYWAMDDELKFETIYWSMVTDNKFDE
ncbi:MAG: hypothetical protein K2X93_00840 [Candidatus Obscuribacterales bacterium]|nr:hypothetical protein [Candidatus Obscuribacterales bacterium]